MTITYVGNTALITSGYCNTFKEIIKSHLVPYLRQIFQYPITPIMKFSKQKKNSYAQPQRQKKETNKK